MITWLVAASATLCLTQLAAEPRSRSYAIVIGENESLDPQVKPLRYADDDAAKNWELFSSISDHSSLFVVLDVETAKLHPNAAKKAEVPDRAAILKRLDEYNLAMAADVARGEAPELFFLYAGHGDVDENGEGYVTLHDGKLTRSSLYQDVVGPSQAKFVHLIVDACKSYFLVKARGKTWRDDAASDDHSDAAVRGLLLETELERHPKAGVIVATSGDQETHEWSRYRAGILSHELRSALSGAADVNHDGKIEYSEVRAFLAAANARVRNPEVKLDVYARPPPLDRHRPLMDLSLASARRVLRFDVAMSGHYSIEDERGVRFADLNKDQGTSFDVGLPNGLGYYVRRNEIDELEIPVNAPAVVELAGARWSSTAIAARGALDETFRKDLYGVPYGRRFYDGFIATSGDVPVEDQTVSLRPSRPVADDTRHRYSVGYLITPAPAGDAGVSHGGTLNYGYVMGPLVLGVGAELGYGVGPRTTMDAQHLTRFAVLPRAQLELSPLSGLLLFADAAAGWQLLSGAVVIDGKRLEGSEPRGLRAELGAGIGWLVSDSALLYLRGGAGLDALDADGAWQLGVQPFFALGAAFQP